MALTIGEFGQKIKQKYPEYRDMDDTELGNKMITKYPQYKDMVDTTMQPPQGGVIGAVGKVTSFLFPRTKEFIQEAKNKAKTMTLEEKQKAMFSATEPVIPKLVRLAKTEEGRKQISKEVAVGGEIAPWFMPVVKAPTGASALQKVLAGAKTGALIGGVTGVTGEGNVGERIKSGAGGAVAGGLTGATITGAIEGVRGLAKGAKGVAKPLYTSTLVENKTTQKLFGKYGGEENFVNNAITWGKIKGKKGVQGELNKFGPEFETKVESALRGSGEKINIDRIIDGLKGEITTDLNNPETAGAYNQAIKYLDRAGKKYQGELSISSANRIRKRIDSKVGGKILEELNSGEAYAMKELAGKLRNAVKDAVPITKPLFDKYSFLSDLVAVTRANPRLGLYEAMAVLTGHPLAGIATYGFRSPAVRRTVAVGLNKAGKVVEKVPETPAFLQKLSGILGSKVVTK